MSGYVQRLASAAVTTLGDLWPEPATVLPEAPEAAAPAATPRRAPRGPARPPAEPPRIAPEPVATPPEPSEPHAPPPHEPPRHEPRPAAAAEPTELEPSPGRVLRSADGRLTAPRQADARAVEPAPRPVAAPPATTMVTHGAHLEAPRRPAPRGATPPRDRRALAATPPAPPFAAVGESAVSRVDQPGEHEARWQELGRRLRAEHPPPAEQPPPAEVSRPGAASPPAAASPPPGETAPEVVIEYLDVRVLPPEPPPAPLGPPRGGAWQHDRVGRP